MNPDLKSLIESMASFAKGTAIMCLDHYCYYKRKLGHFTPSDNVSTCIKKSTNRIVSLFAKQVKEHSGSKIDFLANWIGGYNSLETGEPPPEEEWQSEEGIYLWNSYRFFVVHVALADFEKLFKKIKTDNASANPVELIMDIMQIFFDLKYWEGLHETDWYRTENARAASARGGRHSKIKAPIIKAWVENHFKTDPKHTCAGALSRFRTFKKSAPHDFNGYKLFHSATDEREQFCQISPDGKQQCISEKRFRDYCPPKRPRKNPVK
jgi:hypothetical protein